MSEARRHFNCSAGNGWRKQCLVVPQGTPRVAPESAAPSGAVPLWQRLQARCSAQAFLVPQDRRRPVVNERGPVVSAAADSASHPSSAMGASSAFRASAAPSYHPAAAESFDAAVAANFAADATGVVVLEDPCGGVGVPDPDSLSCRQSICSADVRLGQRIRNPLASSQIHGGALGQGRPERLALQAVVLWGMARLVISASETTTGDTTQGRIPCGPGGRRCSGTGRPCAWGLALCLKRGRGIAGAKTAAELLQTRESPITTRSSSSTP